MIVRNLTNASEGQPFRSCAPWWAQAKNVARAAAGGPSVVLSADFSVDPTVALRDDPLSGSFEFHHLSSTQVVLAAAGTVTFSVVGKVLSVHDELGVFPQRLVGYEIGAPLSAIYSVDRNAVGIAGPTGPITMRYPYRTLSVAIGSSPTIQFGQGFPAPSARVSGIYVDGGNVNAYAVSGFEPRGQEGYWFYEFSLWDPQPPGIFASAALPVKAFEWTRFAFRSHRLQFCVDSPRPRCSTIVGSVENMMVLD